MSLQVVHYPHPTLRHRSRPLRRVDKKLRGLVAQMFELMYEQEGVGLAANQVNLPYRLFVMNPTADADQADQEWVLINPVLSAGKGRVEREEGCLSLPGIHAPVVRHRRLHLEAFDLSGEEVSLDLEDFPARIVQHETDHLDGVLFTDRLSPAQKSVVAPLLEEFEIAYQSQLATGDAPALEAVRQRIAELEKLRT